MSWAPESRKITGKPARSGGVPKLGFGLEKAKIKSHPPRVTAEDFAHSQKNANPSARMGEPSECSSAKSGMSSLGASSLSSRAEGVETRSDKPNKTISRDSDADQAQECLQLYEEFEECKNRMNEICDRFNDIHLSMLKYPPDETSHFLDSLPNGIFNFDNVLRIFIPSDICEKIYLSKNINLSRHRGFMEEWQRDQLRIIMEHLQLKPKPHGSFQLIYSKEQISAFIDYASLRSDELGTIWDEMSAAFDDLDNPDLAKALYIHNFMIAACEAKDIMIEQDYWKLRG